MLVFGLWTPGPGGGEPAPAGVRDSCARSRAAVQNRRQRDVIPGRSTSDVGEVRRLLGFAILSLTTRLGLNALTRGDAGDRPLLTLAAVGSIGACDGWGACSAAG